MTDTAAPSTTSPNPGDAGPSTTAPGAPSGQAGGDAAAAAAIQQQRIDLAAMDPNTIVSVIADGERVEMRAGDAFKRLGREFTANKRFEEAARTRQEAAADRAEAERAIQRISAALADPAEFAALLTEYGVSREQWFAAMAQHHEQEQRLSPAERELRDLKRQQAQREREAEERAQQARAQEVERMQQGWHAAFSSVMKEMGVPEDGGVHDIIMPTLARATLHMQNTEGRNLKKSEVRAIVNNAIQKFGALAQPSAQDRLANMTEDDVRAFMERKNAEVTGRQAAPQLPRNPENGRFMPGDPRAKAEAKARTNVHGKVIVKDPFSLFGR